MKTYLEVRYEDRAAVKALGARWSREAKKWYVIDPEDMSVFSRWLPRRLMLPTDTTWYENKQNELASAYAKVGKKKRVKFVGEVPKINYR